MKMPSKFRLILIVFLSATVFGCGMGSEYEKTKEEYDIGELYKTTNSTISTLSKEVGSAHLMTMDDTNIYFFDPDNLKIYAYSKQGANVETITVPKSKKVYFWNSISLGGGYKWYSRGFAYYNKNLYLLGFSKDMYLKYDLSSKTWEEAVFKTKLPIGIVRDIRKNGEDGWIVLSSDYVIPHGYVDYVYSHLNNDFSLRHNNFSGDEGEFWSFGYQSSYSYGIFLLDTAEIQDTDEAVFYELTETKLLFGIYSGNGQGYYVDKDRKLYSFTLERNK